MGSTTTAIARALPVASAKLLYVVDDDAMFRASVVFLLEAAGFTVVAEMTARSFLAKVPQLQPGIVLVDLRMPDIDGLDLIRLLGDRIKAFPVIVITGHGDIASAARATHLGATDFLEKPVRMEDLVESINATAALQLQAATAIAGENP